LPGHGLEIGNYDAEVDSPATQRKYGPRAEILHYATFGTDQALEMLRQIDAGERPWKIDADLERDIESRIVKEFGAGYRWLDAARHFVCNPLGIRDPLQWVDFRAVAGLSVIEFLYRRSQQP